MKSIDRKMNFLQLKGKMILCNKKERASEVSYKFVTLRIGG